MNYLWTVLVIAFLGREQLLVGARFLMDAALNFSVGWLPLGPAVVTNGLRSVGSILLCGILLILSATLGLSFLRFIVGNRLKATLRMTAPFAGYAVVSLLVFGVAATGLCFPVVLVTVVLIPVLLAWRELSKNLQDIRTAILNLCAEHKIVLAGLVLLIGCWIPRLVLPEINEDCLIYHLILPEHMLLQHRLPEPPFHTTWAYPLLSEFPNVFAISAGLDATVRQINVAFAWLGAVIFLRALVRELPLGWTLLLALSAFLLPNGSVFLGVGKNDAVNCGYAFAAFAVLLESGAFSGRGVNRAQFIYAGFLVGCFVAVKYVLLPLAAVATLIIVLQGFGRTWRVLPLFVGAAALPLVPWIVKSWLRHADPFYPYFVAAFPAIFGIERFSEVIRHKVNTYLQTGVAVRLAFTEALMLILHNAYLGFVGLAGWFRRPSQGAVVVAAVAFVTVSILVLACPGAHTQLERYTYAAMALLNLFGLAGFVHGTSLSNFQGGSNKATWLVCTVAVVVIALNLCWLFRIRPVLTWKETGVSLRERSYLAGRMDAETYRRSLMGSYGLAIPHLKKSAMDNPGGVVLVVGGKFLWDIPRRMIAFGMQQGFIWSTVKDSENQHRLAIKFRQAGIRWVLYDSDFGGWDRLTLGPERWTPRMLRLYTDYAKRHFKPLVATKCTGPGFGQYWIYAVERDAGPPAASIAVLPGADPAFAEATVIGMSGNITSAIRRFEELYKLMPDVTAARNALGHILVQTRRYQEGYAHVRGAAEEGLVNCTEPSLLNWAQAAYMLGRRDEAIDVYQRALKIYTSWPSAPLPQLQAIVDQLPSR